VLGLAQVQPTWNNVFRQELCTILMALFLENHSHSTFVLHKLWQLNPPIVVRRMLEQYFKDTGILSRLLDVAQDLKALPAILEARLFQFAINLAVLASHCEFLFLEKWISDTLLEHGNSFGILFGSLIQHQLVAFLPLGMALRYVLDLLRKPPNSKMFKFDLYALEQFKS